MRLVSQLESLKSLIKLTSNFLSRYIENKLKKNDEKLLIFAHHLCMMDALSQSLTQNGTRFMRIDGSTKADVRDSNVASFQNDPKLRCAILSIGSCSAGITLTAASTVIFAELDWNPSSIMQAEARAHRIGQERQVKCFFLVASGTADDIIWRKLKEKQKNLTDVGLVTVDDHLSQNLAQSEFKAGPSTSKSTPTKLNNLITNYFMQSPNKSSSSTEDFATAQTTLGDDDCAMDTETSVGIMELERKALAFEDFTSDDSSKQSEMNQKAVDDELKGLIFDDEEMLDEETTRALCELEEQKIKEQAEVNELANIEFDDDDDLLLAAAAQIEEDDNDWLMAAASQAESEMRQNFVVNL